MDIHQMLPFLSAPELLLLGRRILASLLRNMKTSPSRPFCLLWRRRMSMP
jgi:hypothetical protein